ncbi:PH domain-containing protein [Flavobacterium litorale]|uniref:PH domain-containing protein n=1 Tax=Flavobacterium litorale TaxID=2856519 RepID=A0ABX8VAX8_9FLAO|nr:PH domain-containing protein [Flavobacterium litorale]QYJ67781.1 PH domain-containing protein [Flavobacterium litorale]
MKPSFNTPQRQSLVGVVVMFTDTLQKSVRALWPVLLLWAFRFNEINKLHLTLGITIIVLVLGVIAYLKYHHFTFFLDEDNDEFVIKEGIFNKTRTAIPLDKIQQVNINQSLIQRLIGVHALEVDTAGSSKKEVAIKAISHNLALALKERLLQSDKTKISTDIAESTVNDEKEPFIAISFVSLLKTGITSNYARSFALLLAFTITVFQNVEEYLDEYTVSEYITTEVLLRFTTFIVIGIIVLILLINLVRTIFKFFDYKIAQQQNALLLSYGLLNTRNTIIRPERVQMVMVRRNYFQKKIDIQDIKIKQTSNSDAASKEQQKSAIEIPGCSTSEKDILLQFLLDKVPERGVALKPNIRKIIVQVAFFLGIPLSIFFFLAYFENNMLYNYSSYVLAYVLFVIALIYFSFKNTRLFVNNDFIIKQSGAWDVDNEFLAPHKIQAIKLKQYFWHKKANIGTVTLYTAGGALAFELADYTRLKQLVNYWTYQVETTNKNWM